MKLHICKSQLYILSFFVAQTLYQGEQGDSPEQKLKDFRLGVKVCAGEAEYDVTELARIKALAAKGPTIFYGRLCEAID